MTTEKITWICNECGKARFDKTTGCATWHVGICDVCKKEKAVTEPRDFYREFDE